MRLYCDSCLEAVDAKEHRMREEMDRDVPNSFYEYSIYTCPHCGSEVYQEPGHCVRCGMEIAPDDEFCECCRDDLFGVVDELQDNGKYTKSQVYEQLDRFLEMEM